MIGTNDIDNIVGFNNDPATVIAQLDTLVTDIAVALPGAVIVLAKIIPITEHPDWSWMRPAYEALIAEIPDVAQKLADAGFKVKYVDMNSTFLESELDDGVHPNAAGYKRMADIWYQAIADYLK